MNTIKELRQNKDVRVFTFTLFNSIIALIVAYITESESAILLVPILNLLTKHINITYFGDMWVEEKK